MRRQYTIQEATLEALQQFPECAYAEARNGLNALLEPTWVVLLWRNEECRLEDDPPRHVVEGFPASRERE